MEIGDVVFEFDEIMEEIGIGRYLKPEEVVSLLGRPGYNEVKLLKTVLFGAMDMGGVPSVRALEDRCKVDLRYRYLMDRETPSYHTFSSFIVSRLSESVEDIFKAVMEYIREKDHVDLQHVYIDGSKFEANANRYSFVWKKRDGETAVQAFRQNFCPFRGDERDAEIRRCPYSGEHGV